MIRVALDTNVLVYAEGIGSTPVDETKARQAKRLLDRTTSAGIRPVVALQSFAELHRILVRKGGFNSRDAASKVSDWRATTEAIATKHIVFDAALELAADHQLQIYDAIIFAAAVHARCDLLLSEDLQDGFAWRGVTVANPFAPTLERHLARLIG